MTALHRICRTLAFATAGLVSAGASNAQSWDIDLCTGGTKLASGFTNCGQAGGTTTATLDVKAYQSTGAGNNFTAANINIQSGYIGVLSGSETSGSSSPSHGIDNDTATGGNPYEAIHLKFSKAVDLGTLVATWSHTDGDFLVFRWNYNAGTPDPTITNFNPNALPGTLGTASNGWQLVDVGDFSTGLSQTITDTTYFSSHWLVTTAFGQTNDGFKLGTMYATTVCAQSQTSTGGCGPTPPSGVPEPSTMAMVLLAGLGATATRRRRRD
jgi:hypothetical protein